MSQNTTNQSDDQEIDLGLLIKKVNGFFGNISLGIFKGLLFLKRKSLILISLFVIGVAAGYFFDRTNKTYDSEIIVSPNLGGTDYLYSKIDFLSAKLKEKDTIFFKNLGIKNLSDIKTIKIEPILDIYSFGNEKPYRIELFGNDVDSIRIFDPETQLSERKLLSVNIIPNTDILQNQSGEQVSLLEFLPENTIVWSEDWGFIKEKIEQQEEDFEIWHSTFGAKQLLKDDESEIHQRNEVAENDFHLGVDNYNSFRIYVDALGRWVVEHHYHPGKEQEIKILGYPSDMHDAFARADKWIMNRYDIKLIDSTEAWRSDGPTDAQKKLLKRIGVPLTADMTKGTASQIISKYYEANPRPTWLDKKVKYSKNRW